MRKMWKLVFRSFNIFHRYLVQMKNVNSFNSFPKVPRKKLDFFVELFFFFFLSVSVATKKINIIKCENNFVSYGSFELGKSPNC